MRLIDADKFLADLFAEGYDVAKIDYRCSLYSEYGYSRDLIKQVVERQSMFVEVEPNIGDGVKNGRKHEKKNQEKCN